MAVCSVCELHAESTFKIEGMDCREEVAMLERRFKNLAGLEDFSADVMAQRLHVKYDAARLTASAIADAVADTGMRAWLEHEEPIVDGASAARRRQALVAVSGGSLAVGLMASWGLGAGNFGLEGLERGWPALIASGLPTLLFAVAIVCGLLAIWRRTVVALKSRSLDINVLMVIAVAGAVALGEYSEAASVIFLFAVAESLEARTLDRARNAIRALMDLTPAEALVRDIAGERRVPADTLAPGAIIVVRPGEKIPLDGEVVAGQSSVNQAPITGESLPIDKASGDHVFAGTINGRGALEVRVTRLRRDTTLARIIHLVERAQAQRAPAQQLVERFARIYTPAVIVLAVLLATVPPLMFGGNWHAWVYRSLVLLVVSCPCALVISTPVSIVAALAAAARKGVLIKGGAHLERTGRIRCVAFDKTGTLTRGAPQVVDVVGIDGSGSAAIIALAAAVEQRSTHPIAHAILEHAALISVPAVAAANVSALSGRGAQGDVGGAHVVLGNHRLFEELKLCSPAIHQQVTQLESTGRTTVLVARDQRPIGIITVADRPREAGKDALAMLREQGVEAVVMLTGDSRSTASVIANELGVDDVRAELLPEDKVAAVEELRRKYGSVAMVGDGINDAPALASADIGIAMGAAGSDAALETADVALMADELLKIPYTFRLSRRTVRNIRANLTISIALKAAFLVAAVAGVATLWMAVVADAGASVLVVANALRLLRAD